MPAKPLAVTPEEIDAMRARLPRAFGRPAGERAAIGLGWVAFFAWLALSCWWFEITPARLWNGLSGLGTIVRMMIPPSPGTNWDEILEAMAQTISMAFLGTLFSAILAVPIGFLGAKNVIPNWVFHFTLRRLFDGMRGIDQLIWALVYVRAVGLGPLAGVLAIFTADLAVLAKLYAEAVENCDRRPVEGVLSVGASGPLLVRFGMLPQVLPVMIAQALYFFESNTRSAAIIGVVGAGGIGLSIAERIRIRAWDEVAFIIILILVTVALIDRLSARVRARLIGDRPLAAY